MLTCLPGYQASQWKWRRHLLVHLTSAPSQKPLRVCHTVPDLHRWAQRQNSRLLPARWSGKLLNPSLPACDHHSSSTAHVRASVSWCQGAPCCSLGVHHGRQTEFRENHPSGQRYHTERKKQSRVKVNIWRVFSWTDNRQMRKGERLKNHILFLYHQQLFIFLRNIGKRNKKQTAVINIRKYKHIFEAERKVFNLTFRMFQHHTISEVINRWIKTDI